MVVSDTHGEIDECINIVNNTNDIELLIHLGDYTKDAEKIKKETKIKTINVKGNCDFSDSITPYERMIKINNKKIFLTHGHKYLVKSTLNKIYYKAKEVSADIILFGHSHMPVSVTHDNILLFNPGSISMPKYGSNKCYGILNVSNKIEHKLIEIE